MGLHTIHALETLMKVSQIIDVFAAGSDSASDDGSGIMLCFRPHKTTTLGRPYIAEHLQQRTGVRGHLQGKPMISVLLSVIEVSHDVVPPAGQKIRLAPHARPWPLGPENRGYRDGRWKTARILAPSRQGVPSPTECRRNRDSKSENRSRKSRESVGSLSGYFRGRGHQLSVDLISRHDQS